MFVELGEISFTDDDVTVKQTETEKIALKLVRTVCNRGRVVVPWSVATEKENSPFKVSSNAIIVT